MDAEKVNETFIEKREAYILFMLGNDEDAIKFWNEYLPAKLKEKEKPCREVK